MAKDYQRLWKDVIDSTGETMAVRALADILADKEGRTFVLSLSRKDAEFCIDILDRVSRDLRPQHSFGFSNGSVRVSQETISEPSPRSRLSTSP